MRFNIDVYAWIGKRETLGRVHIQQQFWKAPTLLLNEEKPQNLQLKSNLYEKFQNTYSTVLALLHAKRRIGRHDEANRRTSVTF
jgi:hypothetical protein